MRKRFNVTGLCIPQKHYMVTEYLDYYQLKKGYMVSFNFNKKKQVGIHEIALGDKILVEAVV